VLDHAHVRQRVDRHHVLPAVLDRARAGQGVGPVDVHRARTADALAAGTAEGQRGVDLVLDLDQRVQDHRTALVEVDLVGVGARVLAVVRVPAVHLEGAHARRPGGRLEVAALADLRVLREREFSHGRSVVSQYTRATGGTTSTSSSSVYMWTGR